MRSFVFTLGFHEDYILRRLREKAAQPGEPITIFTAEPVVSGVSRAYESLASFCSSLGLDRPRLVPLNMAAPAYSLTQARSVIQRLPRPIVVDLGGGFRSLVLLVFVALLTGCEDFELHVSVETGEEHGLYMPRGVVRALKRLSPEKREILAYIGRSPGITAELLARRLGRSVKTVRNHLTELKAMGLIAARGRGAPLKLTEWGEALAAAEDR